MPKRRTRQGASHHRIAAAAPFRLDLTVSALRRLPSNIVDVLTPEGQYLRALPGAHRPVIVRVAQKDADALSVTLSGTASDRAPALSLVRRMLGVDRDLSHFERAAKQVPWLRPLARRMRGVKPPRYPTLWEACVNVIVFQQVSLKAASTIVSRLVLALGSRVESEGISLYPFPNAERVLSADDGALRATGLSPAKLATLRRVGEALASGTLDEAMLEERSSPDAMKLLRQIKGIGPWSATVILLRGLGRLDVFPMNDSSVAHNLASVGGPAPTNVADVLEKLGPERGMLYYYLLLARLEANGGIGQPSLAP